MYLFVFVYFLPAQILIDNYAWEQSYLESGRLPGTIYADLFMQMATLETDDLLHWADLPPLEDLDASSSQAYLKYSE